MDQRAPFAQQELDLLFEKPPLAARAQQIPAFGHLGLPCFSAFVVLLPEVFDDLI
jgi:hypothetical protein